MFLFHKRFPGNAGSYIKIDFDFPISRWNSLETNLKFNRLTSGLNSIFKVACRNPKSDDAYVE